MKLRYTGNCLDINIQTGKDRPGYYFGSSNDYVQDIELEDAKILIESAPNVWKPVEDIPVDPVDVTNTPLVREYPQEDAATTVDQEGLETVCRPICDAGVFTSMTKKDLVEYAKETLGVELNVASTKAEIIDAIMAVQDEGRP